MGGWRGREKRREDGGGERRDGRKVLTLTAKVCCPGFWNPKPGVPSYLESDVGTFTFSFLPFCSSSSWYHPLRPYGRGRGKGGWHTRSIAVMLRYLSPCWVRAGQTQGRTCCQPSHSYQIRGREIVHHTTLPPQGRPSEFFYLVKDLRRWRTGCFSV